MKLQFWVGGLEYSQPKLSVILELTEVGYPAPADMPTFMYINIQVYEYQDGTLEGKMGNL